MQSPDTPTFDLATAAPRAAVRRRVLVPGGPWLRRRLPKRSAIPLLAMVVGLFLPAMAGAAGLASSILAISVFFGTVSLPSAERLAWRGGATQAVTASVALLLLGPALTAAACAVAVHCGLPAEDCIWATMAAGAPVSVGAVITARSLGIDQRRMAAVMVLSNIGAPLILPQLAWLSGIEGAAGVGALSRQMALTSLLPLLLGLAMRRFPPVATARARRAASDLGMAALMAVGLLRGAGLSAGVMSNLQGDLPILVLALIAAASGPCAIWLVLRVWPDSMLAGVYRSNTLVWASLAGVLTERANLLMALVTLATYGAPVIAGWAQRLCPGHQGGGR